MGLITRFTPTPVHSAELWLILDTRPDRATLLEIVQLFLQSQIPLWTFFGFCKSELKFFFPPHCSDPHASLLPSRSCSTLKAAVARKGAKNAVCFEVRSEVQAPSEFRNKHWMSICVCSCGHSLCVTFQCAPCVLGMLRKWNKSFVTSGGELAQWGCCCCSCRRILIQASHSALHQ